MPSFNMTGVLKRRGSLGTQRDNRHHRACAKGGPREAEEADVRKPQRSHIYQSLILDHRPPELWKKKNSLLFKAPTL